MVVGPVAGFLIAERSSSSCLEAVSSARSCLGPGCVWGCLVTQSCPTLCDPVDCSPSGSSVRGNSPGKTTGVGFDVLLQGIFPTQGLNPGLLNCRQILHHLSHLISPFLLDFFFLSLSNNNRYRDKVEREPDTGRNRKSDQRGTQRPLIF